MTTETDSSDEQMSENVRLLLAHFHQTEQARLERAKARLRAEVLPALRNHRVANIEAAYSGCGDSGAIDGVQYRDMAGERVDRTTIPQPLVEQLETCIYELLPSGFEINDGGQGHDPSSGKLHRDPRFQPGVRPVMAHPYHHAESSARKCGGIPEEYLRFHEFLDASKSHMADFRHRALRHHSEGLFLLEEFFVTTTVLSTGRRLPVRLIAEQHVLEDLGRIPTVADWLGKIQPEPWMLGKGREQVRE